MGKMRLKWVALILLLIAGCATAPTYRAHPSFEEQVSIIKTIALMPPDVKIYRLTAGGVTELIDEWSEQGKRNAANAVASILAEKGGFTFRDFLPGDDPKLKENYEDIRALLEAVVGTTAYEVWIPEKRETFRYTLGPLPELAQATGAEALLFVVGRENISTGGRVALAIVGGLFTGVQIPLGAEALIAVLVEAKSGDVLWFNVAGGGGAFDLRDAASVHALAEKLLRGFEPTKSRR